MFSKLEPNKTRRELGFEEAGQGKQHDPIIKESEEPDIVPVKRGPILAFWGRIPLAIQITAWFTLFLGLMMSLLIVFIIEFSHQWENSMMTSALQSRVISVADYPYDFKGFKDGIYTAMFSQQGIFLRGELPENFPVNAPFNPHHVTEITVDGKTYFYYDSPLWGEENQYWLRGVVSVAQSSYKTNILVFVLLVGGVLFWLVSVAGGYLLVRRGLMPIRNITHLAAEIGRQRDLSKRISVSNTSDDEIGELASTFNEMLSGLDESARRVRQFNSDVSHELRTPIAVIQAESDFGRTYTTSVEEAKESFDHIFKQSQFMTAIISQLLGMARLDSLSDVPMKALDLTALVLDIAREFKNIHQQSSITMYVSVEENLCIKANTVLFKRAVANLVDNAYKFAKTTVHLRAFMYGDRIRIVVEDDGVGIAKENLSKIWDRLYQTDSSRKKSSNQGLGIGLYFVKNVLSFHHAKAYVESVPGKCTQFTIEVPALQRRCSEKD